MISVRAMTPSGISCPTVRARRVKVEVFVSFVWRNAIHRGLVAVMKAGVRMTLRLMGLPALFRTGW